MTFSYYPGCTLRTKAVELDRSARAAAAALGVTLEEIPEWQCCGGVYPMAKDEIATKLSSVRTLAAARDAGVPWVFAEQETWEQDAFVCMAQSLDYLQKQGLTL